MSDTSILLGGIFIACSALRVLVLIFIGHVELRKHGYEAYEATEINRYRAVYTILLLASACLNGKNIQAPTELAIAGSVSEVTLWNLIILEVMSTWAMLKGGGKGNRDNDGGGPVLPV